MIWSLVPNVLIGSIGMFAYDGVQGWIAYVAFTIISFIPIVRWPSLFAFLYWAQHLALLKSLLICAAVCVVYHWAKTITLAIDIQRANASKT